MLPEGWKRLTVGDVCTMQNGRGFGPEDWVTEGLPIIRIQNLNGGNNFDYYAGPTDPRWVVEPNQLLFAWAGTRGVSFGPAIWRGRRGVLNQHIFKIDARPGIDMEWLYWALKHVTDRVETQAHGFKATLLHVKKSDIDRQGVLVPPVEEQREQTTILNTWDDAIATSEKALANSHKQRQVLINILLGGKTRFLPDRAWRKQKLSDLIVESRISGSGGDVAKKITVKLYGRGVVAKDEKRAGSDSTQYYRRKAGQFIYSKLDFLNGAFGLIPDALDGYESTLDLPAFDFRDGVDPRWFLYYVSREDFYLGHLGLANGGRKARRVNPVDLLRVAIDVPEITEQRAIADAIDTAIADEKTLENMVANLKAQKHALMAELLTGKRRVHIPEAVAAAAVS